MKNVSVVIGSNFGDEGKGLVTDYLATKSDCPVVVRFNGGCQAGHTVVTPGGQRHVFHHIGSGTIAGASTYLSEYFVVNPMFFAAERRELMERSWRSEVYVDWQCPVTTPYDVMLNQAVEKWRGNRRHGSCGMGFNETIERHNTQCKYDNFALNFSNLYDPLYLKQKLEYIQTEYIPMRWSIISNDAPMPDDFKKNLKNKEILKRFLIDIEDMLRLCLKVGWSEVRGWDKDFIFEGAQGLLLDMDAPFFPNVTRSKTGLHNVEELLKRADRKEVDAYYVTRYYMTRHGAGPFPTEVHGVSPLGRKWLEEDTNLPNEFQGVIRTGFLDLNQLDLYISNDINRAQSLNCKVNMVVTCLDRNSHDKIEYIQDSELKEMSPNDFVYHAAGTVGAAHVLQSWGPTRETVRTEGQSNGGCN